MYEWVLSLFRGAKIVSFGQSGNTNFLVFCCSTLYNLEKTTENLVFSLPDNTKKALQQRRNALMISVVVELCLNLLVLRNERLHDRPTDEISNCAEAEYHHISCWLTRECKECESITLLCSIGKELTRTSVDNH